MKKLLTFMLLGLMIIGLCGCNKKEEVVTENMSATINVDNGDPAAVRSFNVGFDEGNSSFISLIAGLKDSGILSFGTEVNDGKEVFTIVDGKIAAEGGSWKVMVNNTEYEGLFKDLTVSGGDVIDIVLDEPAPLLGAWELYEKYTAVVKAEEKEVFEKAMEGLTGVGYEPVRVLATQVVSGTNYAFLAMGTTVTAEPKKDYYILRIYADLEGNAELKSINKVEIPDPETKEEENSVLLGGWEIAPIDNSAIFPDEDAQKSFGLAASLYTDVMLEPMQLLATQLVSGMNYLALCRGYGPDSGPLGSLYIVKWYADLNGNSTITEAKLLNLEYYVAGE
ncbi:MAG: hypothetical protein IJI83_06785 [Oscillospiraceae bacterium]|nr:hypothetical protein [Oscillospiraceae bacterium]